MKMWWPRVAHALATLAPCPPPRALLNISVQFLDIFSFLLSSCSCSFLPVILSLGGHNGKLQCSRHPWESPLEAWDVQAEVGVFTGSGTPLCSPRAVTLQGGRECSRRHLESTVLPSWRCQQGQQSALRPRRGAHLEQPQIYKESLK